MKSALRIIACALGLLIATTAPAHADPISAAIVAIANAITWEAVATAIISTALSLGSSLLLRKKPKQIGQKLNEQIGGDHPLAFGVGLYATPGQRVYVGTWGQDGKTPNAYLTFVYLLSDVPIDGLNGFFVNGERNTFSGAAVEQGTPLAQWRVGGKDHLWVKFYDGTQTDADSFLVSKFGSAARSWTHDHIGFGRAYVAVTLLFNRELFNGVPQFMFELRGIKCYDPRKDISLGGLHREDQPLTWEYTTNLALIGRQILKGVRFGDEHVYGGQTIASARLPASAWIAGANEADAATETLVGGTEPQFRVGCEIDCDLEPADALEALFGACGAKLVEVGGVWKPRIGPPGAAVWAFTDSDIIVSEGQKLTPFQTLQGRHNRVEASYPEPAEGWAMKPAPARKDDAAIARERGKQLTLPLDQSVVPYNSQVQRRMATALAEAQRQKAHRFGLPPIAWLFEPGDVIAWTSERNGYDAKLFPIEEMAGRRTFIQQVAIKEADPADYDWSSDDEVPVTHYPVTIVRPPAQPMTGFQAFPASFEDQSGQGHPSIEVRYATELTDVRAIRVQVRLAPAGALVFDGEVPYDPDSDRLIINAVFLPDTDYEARARFVPFSARETEWSAWLPVTTPDISFLVGPGSIDLDKLGDDVKGLQQWYAERLRALQEDALNLEKQIGEMQLGDWSDRKLIRTELKVATNNLRAGYTNAIFTAVGPNSALAGRIETLEVALDDGEGAPIAVAEAIDALTVEIEDTQEALTIQAAAITTLETGLTNAEGDIAATNLVLSGLGSEITAIEGDITSINSQITALESGLTNAEGDILANAGAISSLTTTVGSQGSTLSAHSAALIGLNAATGGNFANARFGMEAAATPVDALARIALKVAATGGGAKSEAGIYLDALSGGQARIVLDALKVIISSGGVASALFEPGGAFFNKVHIKELVADNWDFNAGVSIGGTGATNQISTASTSFVNMAGMSGLTRMIDEDSAALILFQASMWASNSNRRINTVLETVNASQGTRTLGSGAFTHFHSASSNVAGQVMGFAVADLIAGTHTFNVKWSIDDDTANCSHRRLAIIAFKKATFSGLTGSSSQSGGGSGSGGGFPDWKVTP